MRLDSESATSDWALSMIAERFWDEAEATAVDEGTATLTATPRTAPIFFSQAAWLESDASFASPVSDDMRYAFISFRLAEAGIPYIRGRNFLAISARASVDPVRNPNCPLAFIEGRRYKL
jgi:hypothetical protein